MIDVRYSIVGAERLKKAMELAPRDINNAKFSWLISEKDKFIGSKKKRKDGVWRRFLQRKKNSGGQLWDKRISRIFHGYIHRIPGIDMQVLEMGVGLRGRTSPLLKGLKILGSGGTITSSKGYMIVPLYGNLTKKTETYKQFRELNNNDRLFSIRSNNKLIYFEKNDDGEVIFERPLFVGVKSIRVKKQFDFERRWNQRIPKVLIRGQKRLDRAVLRVEKRMGVVPDGN